MRAAMLAAGVRFWRPLRRQAARPEAAQQAALLRILRLNRDTRFSQEHGLGDIRDMRSFQRRVPVLDYEHLRPYIDEQRLTGRRSLTCEAPLFYAQTSGSTAAPKLIPVTATSLRMHREEQALFSYLQHRACPAAFAGRAWGVMGAVTEGRLDSGHDVGSVSGHLYQSLPRPIRARFVIPPLVSSIDDYETRYRAILYLALAEPHITYLGTPNPSTWLRLLALMRSERDRFADAIASGAVEAVADVPAPLRAALRLPPNPGRAAALRRLEPFTYATVWPWIALVTTWTGGSCGIAVEALRRELPPGARIMELGYQATECRGTIALDTASAAGVPPLHHHFFEFAEQGAWDAGNRACLTLEQLETGRSYYVLVTTAAGLYRYFMNDLVVVDGYLERTPLLRFLQKGRGVTSLTGEKLYESQAIAAVQQGARSAGVDPHFFLLLADEERSRYELLLECEGTFDIAALAGAVDARLGELNVEYQAKRASGRLGPLMAVRLTAGAAESHKTAYVSAGQREAQFKPVILQYRRELRWACEAFVAS